VALLVVFGLGVAAAGWLSLVRSDAATRALADEMYGGGADLDEVVRRYLRGRP